MSNSIQAPEGMTLDEAIKCFNLKKECWEFNRRFSIPEDLVIFQTLAWSDPVAIVIRKKGDDYEPYGFLQANEIDHLLWCRWDGRKFFLAGHCAPDEFKDLASYLTDIMLTGWSQKEAHSQEGGTNK